MRRTGTVYKTMTLDPRPQRDDSRGSPGTLADLLGALPRVAPPPFLKDRVLAAFDARGRLGVRESGERSFRQPRGRLLWLRPALLGATAAAAAVLAVGLFGGSSLLSPALMSAGRGAPPARSTRWVTIAEAPASAPFRFVDDPSLPSLPFQLAAAGPLDGP